MLKLDVPNLSTKRLSLEPLSFDHSQGMFSLWSDEFVIKYSGTVADIKGNTIEMPAKTSDQSDLIIDFWLEAINKGWGFRWAVHLKENQKAFVGTVGFNSLEEEYELAFHLIPKFWGKGIMTEASKSAVEWAARNGAKTIVAFIEDENQSSIELARRLGLVATSELSSGARKYKLSLL